MRGQVTGSGEAASAHVADVRPGRCCGRCSRIGRYCDRCSRCCVLAACGCSSSSRAAPAAAAARRARTSVPIPWSVRALLLVQRQPSSVLGHELALPEPAEERFVDRSERRRRRSFSLWLAFRLLLRPSGLPLFNRSSHDVSPCGAVLCGGLPFRRRLQLDGQVAPHHVPPSLCCPTERSGPLASSFHRNGSMASSPRVLPTSSFAPA